MTLAGLVKLGRMIGKGMGLVQKQSRLAEQKRKGVDDEGYGYGLDSFADFGGSKGGPVNGMLKMLQMLM